MMKDDLVSPLRVVSVRDEAIDWASMWDRGVSPRVYAETRDPESVRALPGMALRWYTLRPLTVADCGTVDALPSDPMKLTQAFRLSVSEVVGFHGLGTAFRPTLPMPMPDGSTRMVWSDADLQHLADVAGGMRLIYEIGAIAFERAQEGNAFRGGVTFAPPPFLLHVLAQKMRLLAERTIPTAGTPSSARPESSSTTTSASGSGAATGASAASGHTVPDAAPPPT